MHPAIAHRGIHLDFKAAPLQIDCLIDEIQQLARWGVNLLLIEYEDAFPYGFDPQLAAASAYTPDQIGRLVSACQSLDVQIVPLVQTFGHIEFVLKHPKYADLAQTAGGVGSLDPTVPAGRQLVMTMLDEIVAAHPHSRWLHLGGDEVWDLGQGHRSRQRAEQIGKPGLYLEHMMPIIEHAGSLGVRPILWDDMMRTWPGDALTALADKADLMPWSYRDDPINTIGESTLAAFQDAGVRLWAAAAFKGGNDWTADLPDDRVRLANLDAWARHVVEHRWQGMVATGWSRYNHLASYCELWPAAPMALYMSAEAMRLGQLSATAWPDACRQTIGVQGLPVDWATSPSPYDALASAAESGDNPRLDRLKAIAAIAQWRRRAQSLFHGQWQGLGYIEEPARFNTVYLDRVGGHVRRLETDWPGLAEQFARAMQPVLYDQDIRDYLASRRRMGLQPFGESAC